VLALLAASFPAAKALTMLGLTGADPDPSPFASRPFQPTRESLSSYRIPEWFRDAKFGIWAHWGPQSAPEAGDWYARQMYIQGHEQYEHHLKTYGHPSKFGFKDIIQTWKGDKFDPDYLLSLYKKAGAKYFVSMGVHHDNFDLWNSQYNRWNAVNMGIKKDVVGMFRQAALKHGLRFGVSDHLWISYKWFATSHYSDQTGPLAGVAYDGADPKFAGLYHDYSELKQTPPVKLDWDETWIPESWKQHWLLRIKDLVDQYQPDYVYSDGSIQFEQYGLDLVSHFYNQNAVRHGGRTEAVFTSKRPEDCHAGTCLLDRERGVLDEIWPDPWQTDTCVGDWHYKRDIEYKTPKAIIDMLVDIVSKNGNLMLNFPLPNSGMLDDRELKILSAITDWMSINGEAIFSTRPWKISGQTSAAINIAQEAMFNEKNRKPLTQADVRFTTKEQHLYAFVMATPEKLATIAALSTGSPHAPGKIDNVELMGFPGKLNWTRNQSGLHIQMPDQKPSDLAIAFRIDGAGLV